MTNLVCFLQALVVCIVTKAIYIHNIDSKCHTYKVIGKSHIEFLFFNGLSDEHAHAHTHTHTQSQTDR